jgi:hypothetical protein
VRRSSPSPSSSSSLLAHRISSSHLDPEAARHSKKRKRRADDGDTRAADQHARLLWLSRKNEEEHKKEEVPHSWSISNGKKQEGDDEEAEVGTLRPGLLLDRDCDGDGSWWWWWRRRPNATKDEGTSAATSISTLISTSSGTCSEATARRTFRDHRPPSDEKRKRKRTRIRRSIPRWWGVDSLLLLLLLLLRWDTKLCSTTPSNDGVQHDLRFLLQILLLLLRDAETEAKQVTGPLSRDKVGLGTGNARRGRGRGLGLDLGPVARTRRRDGGGKDCGDSDGEDTRKRPRAGVVRSEMRMSAMPSREVHFGDCRHGSRSASLYRYR